MPVNQGTLRAKAEVTLPSTGAQVLQESVKPGVLRTKSDYYWSVFLVVLSILGFVIATDRVIHWFLVPLSICGILGAAEIVRWARYRRDFFDPETILGMLVFYGFFIVPLLHAAWDRFGAGYDFIVHGDERDWLGWMACLNAVGLVLWRSLAILAFRHASPSKKTWQINPDRARLVFGIGIASSVCGLGYLLYRLGGIAGIIASYEGYQEAFTGTGWLLIFAWPFTIVCFITMSSLWEEAVMGRKSPYFRAITLLALTGVVHFLIMGWRGSRSATVWAVFWIAGIVHYRYRRFSTPVVATGTIFLVAFMYFYGFYKERGTEGVEVLRNPRMWMDPKGYQRDFKGLLLGDLARADTQAFLLYSLVSNNPGDYDYRWGATYLGGFAILIPRNLWPNRPEFKVDAGTEAQHGKATALRSSRVYGVAGEAMLNFGPLGVPLAYAFYGFLLGWYRRKFTSWDIGDSRLMLAPFFTIMFVSALIGDSDNLIFGAITQGALVATCLYLASRRIPRHKLQRA